MSRAVKAWRIRVGGLPVEVKEMKSLRSLRVSLPVLPHTAYVVWTQYVTPDPSNPNDFSAPALLSLTRDGGRTWSKPKVIVPAAFREGTIGNVIIPDPRNGRLYDLYERTVFDVQGNPVSSDYDVVHSDDHGVTWSAPTKVVDDTNLVVNDPNTGAPVRTSVGVQALGAIDSRTGELFVVWEAANFSGGLYNEIGITSSKDGGQTWSVPRRVNRPTGRRSIPPSRSPGTAPSVSATWTSGRSLRQTRLRCLPARGW